MKKLLTGMLIALLVLSCTSCTGLDALSDNLKGGIDRLGDDRLEKVTRLSRPISPLTEAAHLIMPLFLRPMTLT